MNRIQIPIRRVHLETVFESAAAEQFALLEPHGGAAPLRVRLKDLRAKLTEHFHVELAGTEVVRRLNGSRDRELLLTLELGRGQGACWDVDLRVAHPYEEAERRRPVDLSELRSSPRTRPDVAGDVRLELGERTIEGTIYNVSEHGLGIALLTSDLSELGTSQVDQQVELVGEERIHGRIKSQYPAAGGCVLGIELEQKFDLERYLKVEA